MSACPSGGPPTSGFWHGDEIRAELGDPSFTVDDTTPVVLERFEMVERLP
jgi:hypothetical protein